MGAKTLEILTQIAPRVTRAAVIRDATGVGGAGELEVDSRAAVDFAACMRELTDVHFPMAERIRLVLDNLSTHSAGALYQAFPAAEARRVRRRLEFHYVPKHASWLNMVEIEIGVPPGSKPVPPEAACLLKPRWGLIPNPGPLCAPHRQIWDTRYDQAHCRQNRTHGAHGLLVRPPHRLDVGPLLCGRRRDVGTGRSPARRSQIRTEPGFSRAKPGPRVQFFKEEKGRPGAGGFSPGYPFCSPGNESSQGEWPAAALKSELPAGGSDDLLELVRRGATPDPAPPARLSSQGGPLFGPTGHRSDVRATVSPRARCRCRPASARLLCRQ
jgi:hypothetical protein